MLTLRRAEPRDAALVHRFVVELAEYECEPGAVETTPELLRAQLEADAPPFECVLAEWSDEPVGFALYFNTYSTWRGRRGLWLEDLFVRHSHRGKGIGRTLLARLAAVAVERGCARMEWSVLDWNALAIGFYERLGARPMDAWTTFRLTDEALHRLAEDAPTSSPLAP
ncbi:MAG: GNAT family N-acetyltransferase [Deltaproteobacteria bacterium]|nr:GNAT family N-acetyltransferase [Deltaproteobacteria bacterium]